MQDDNQFKIGTELLVNSLKDEGVEIVFGYPGGAVLHIYDQFFKSEVNHILARHEQGSAHMADGYARATGKTGVCVATSGPGATNTVTAVATAKLDSVPMVVITGQVAEDSIGKDAFQETDILGVMTPITKHAYQVHKASDIPRIVHEAFHIASTGRKGPVLIDIPKNIGVEEAELMDSSNQMDLPAYDPRIEVDQDQVEAVMDAISTSKKPLILLGNGVAAAGAEKEFKKFIHEYNIPVTSTLLGLGILPPDDELFLGMAGMHGTYASNMALMETDCLINIGSRFDDRVASDPNNFAPHATIIHIDIDPSEHGKVIQPDYALLGDAKDVLEAMLDSPLHGFEASADWLDHQKANKEKHPLKVPSGGQFIRPQRAIEYLGEKTNGEATIVTDVGQHQMWAAQYYPFKYPNQQLTSGGLGTMGYCIPATIGAAFGQKDKPVIGIAGDGGFQMTNQELNMIQHYDIKPKFIILNNTVLGMVHQWQHKFYEDRYSGSEFGNALPDFVQLSEALGVKAARVTDPNDLEKAMDEMLEYDGAYVLEVLIDKHELVTPMVASGSPNNEMEGL